MATISEPNFRSKCGQKQSKALQIRGEFKSDPSMKGRSSKAKVQKQVSIPTQQESAKKGHFVGEQQESIAIEVKK
jgi:hypothetical protein